MATIEPMSSIMTYQAQSGAPAPVAQKVQETNEGAAVETKAPVVDDKTLSVNKADDANDREQGEDKEGSLDSEMMRQAIKELNKKSSNVEAEFGIHEKTHRITIKMVDKNTKKVIKELPPEKMLDMVARIWEIAGLVVDEKR